MYNKANDFSNSVNHGVQANTVYGEIHHHHSPTSTVISQQRIADAISRADTVIRDYYESSDRLKIERLSGDMLPLENCYINLRLVDQVDAKKIQVNDLSFSLEKRLNLEAGDNEKQITLGELFTPRKLLNGTTTEPRRLFIEGRAGVGKTTLCKKIVHEFLHHNLGAKLFDRLLWVPLRRLKSKPGRYEWRNFIEDAYSPQVVDWDELASVMSGQLYDKVYLSKTLFLFDSLDEISHGWKPDDPMYERLQTIICDVPNLIVTSRPQAKTFNIGKFDLELETLGFTLDQVNAYLEKCIGDAETVLKVKSFIAQKPLIKGLMRIPIQLDAFCCVWPSEAVSNADQELSNIPTYGDLSTMTTLYQSIVTKLFRKDVERLKKSEQIRGFGDTRIGRLLQEECRVLEEFAYQGLANGIAAFSPRQVNTIEHYLFNKDNQPILCEISSLERLSFLRTSDIKQDKSRKNYHFLHLTFQEFFAAKHFVRHWRTNAYLTRLDLVRGETMDKISPLEFLRHKKYNPQLNIFWRFVAGLIQLQPDEGVKLIDPDRSSEHCNNQNILTFFAQLHSEPIDLLRSAHIRLLMSCLSEVVPGQGQEEAKELCKTEEDRLRKKLIQEKHVNSYNYIGHWSEFPESILCDLLQHEEHSLYALRLLEYRDTITSETLELVSSKLATNFSTDIRFGVSKVIIKHWRTCPQNIRIMNITFLIAMLGDEDKNVRRQAGLQLNGCLYLPEEAILLLTTMLGHKDRSVNYHIAYILIRHWPVTKKVANLSISTLITMLMEANIDQDNLSYFRLGYEESLPEEVITALITTLKDEDGKVRNYAASLLRCHRRLPREDVAALVTMLRDDNMSVGLYAAKVLQVQSLLSGEVINDLVIMLREDREAQGFAAGVLLGRPSLSQQVSISSVISLTTMLRDENPMARKFAAKVIRYQSFLPQETIDALTAILKDKNDDNLANDAIIVLIGQSALSQETIDALITILKDKYNDLAENVILALRGQSFLPQESTNILATMLKDKTNKTLRVRSALVLGKQSSFHQEAINSVVATLEDPPKYSNSRLHSLVIKVLASQPSLPKEVINVLAAMAVVEHRHISYCESPTHVLMKQSSLSRYTITTLIAALKKDRSRHLYRVLHRRNIYSNIADLDDGAWQQLFSYWLVSDVSILNSISCYELDGSLYIWSGATLYKYPASSPRTQELIKIARDVIKKQQETETTSNSDKQAEDTHEVPKNTQVRRSQRIKTSSISGQKRKRDA